MVSKVILFLEILISLSQAISCTKFTCASLTGANICASKTTSNSVIVNQAGCYSSNYFCSYTLTLDWAMTSITSSTFPCLIKSTSSGTSTTWSNKSCVKVANKTFKNGATAPIACSSDSECPLADGTHASCTCALSITGKGICKPDHNNDSIFSGYWNECGSDNIIDDEAAYNYWTYYEATWVYQNSGLSCINIFSEHQVLNELYDTYQATLSPGTTGATGGTGTTGGTSTTGGTTAGNEDSSNFAVGAFGIAALLA